MNSTAVTGDSAEISHMSLLGGEADAPPDIVCLSRLQWDFAGRRPQRLMSRSALERRVFFVEEPVFGAAVSGLDIRRRDCGVYVVTPHLREGPDDAETPSVEQALLLDELFLEYEVCDYILWYYTSAAVASTWRLDPLLVVYDCVNEPSAFNLRRRARNGAKPNCSNSPTWSSPADTASTKRSAVFITTSILSRTALISSISAEPDARSRSLQTRLASGARASGSPARSMGAWTWSYWPRSPGRGPIGRS